MLCASWLSPTSQACAACMMMVSSSNHMHVVHMDHCLHQTSTAGLVALSWVIMSVVQKALQRNIMKALCRSTRVLKLCERGSPVITATRTEQQCDVLTFIYTPNLRSLLDWTNRANRIEEDTVKCQAIRAFKLYALMMPFGLRTGADKTLDSACRTGALKRLVCM